MKKLSLLIPLLILSSCGEATYTAKEACLEETTREFTNEYPIDGMNGEMYTVSIIELEYIYLDGEMVRLPEFTKDYIGRSFVFDFAFEPIDNEPDTGLCGCDGFIEVRYYAFIAYDEKYMSLGYSANATIGHIFDLDIAKVGIV